MSKTENKEKETKVTDEEEIKETEEVSEEVTGENAAEDTAEVSDGKEAEKDGKEAKEEIKVDPKDLEIADLKDKLLRNMAEFDNYRKHRQGAYGACAGDNGKESYGVLTGHG